jgi:transcriptional regulator with GAF, ATPase, and Fis domain
MKQKTWAEIRAHSLNFLRKQLRAALDKYDWNLTATAKALRVPISTLQSLILSHDVKAEYAIRAHKPGRPKKAKPDA